MSDITYSEKGRSVAKRVLWLAKGGVSVTAPIHEFLHRCDTHWRPAHARRYC